MLLGVECQVRVPAITVQMFNTAFASLFKVVLHAQEAHSIIKVMFNLGKIS